MLIDEEEMFRELLRGYLSAQPDIEVIADAGGSCRGVELCAEKRPDLVVLNMACPRVGGRELADVLRQENPALPILLISEDTEAATLSRALDLKAQGFVEKGQSLASLLEALRAVDRGQSWFSPAFAAAQVHFADDPSAFIKILSRREQEILALVGQGLTSRRIAKKTSLSARTVETHRYNIMKKMHFPDLAAMIRFAIRGGFRHNNCDRNPTRGGACRTCRPAKPSRPGSISRDLLLSNGSPDESLPLREASPFRRAPGIGQP